MGPAYTPNNTPGSPGATRGSSANNPLEGPKHDNPSVRDSNQLWLDRDQTYEKPWSPHLLAGILDTQPTVPVDGQKDARTSALWPADKLHMSPESVSRETDPRNRAMAFALAAGPAFLSSLCNTYWGTDGHLAALLATCAYGLGANRSSVFITGAPGSGKTRSCAFMGVLVASLASKLTLYTAHGNESVSIHRSRGPADCGEQQLHPKSYCKSTSQP